MKKTTILKLINHLNNIINQKTSIKEYALKSGFPENYFYNKREAVKEAHKNGTIDDDQFEAIINLFEEAKSTKGKAPEVKSKEDASYRSEVTQERDDEGRIVKYHFISYIKNKESLKGSFSRDEMNLIYRLYSNYGSKITQREISRFFPEYSLEDFKRVLRAFNITKASAPFAPHMFEEKDNDELLNIQFREKENDFLRNYEAERIRQTESQLKKYMKENYDLKEQISNAQEIIKDLDLSKVHKYVGSKCTDYPGSTLIIWLSDMHIGAYVSNTSIYCNTYDKSEVIRRLDYIIKDLERLVDSGVSINKVVVCNLGDSLDGMDSQTTRRDHMLPQNMTNKEQLSCFLESMLYFFDQLNGLLDCPMSYYCVGESNHDGDFGYAANLALACALDKKGVNTTVFDKFIGEFTINNNTYVICHGN